MPHGVDRAPSPPSLSPRPTHRPAAMAPASATRTSSRARLRSGASRVWVGGFAHGGDCPRSGWCVGGWDTGPVSMQPQPAPRPQKSRLLQDGRDMFWSLAPPVGLPCAHRNGRHVLFFQGSGPQRGQIPNYDVATALKADAETLGFPIRSRRCPTVAPNFWVPRRNPRGAQRPGDGSAGPRRRCPRSATSHPRACT